MAYLLDANIFIQAKNLHYGFDFCPAFWDWLAKSHVAGTVISIEKVGLELQAGADELSSWSQTMGDDFFARPDVADLQALGIVSNWAISQNYEPVAVNTFLQVADYYLVANGLAHGHVVVTHEIPSTSTKRIKIPNACVGVGVRVISPFEMLRAERAVHSLNIG